MLANVFFTLSVLKEHGFYKDPTQLGAICRCFLTLLLVQFRCFFSGLQAEEEAGWYLVTIVFVTKVAVRRHFDLSECQEIVNLVY